MSILLMSLTAVGVLILFGALALYLVRISVTLEEIGLEPVSYLGKISFGVRAIERETAALEPQITELNVGLSEAATGLQGIRDELGAALEAVQRQEA